MRFIRYTLFLTLIPCIVFGQNKIHINVTVLNSLSGAKISASSVVRVNYINGSTIPITSTKKETYYEIDTESEFTINANAEGFYPNQLHFSAQNLFDGDILTIKLNPKPSSEISIIGIDTETQEPVSFTLSIIDMDGKLIEKLNIPRAGARYNTTRFGKIKLKAESTNYPVIEIDENFTGSVNNNPQLVRLNFQKANSFQQYFTIEGATNTIQNASYKIISKNNTIHKGNFNNQIPLIALTEGQNYTIEVNANGYFPIREAFTARSESIKLKLLSNPKILISMTYQNQLVNGIKFRLFKNNDLFLETVINKTYELVTPEYGEYRAEVESEEYLPQVSVFKLDGKNEGDFKLDYQLISKYKNIHLLVQDIDSKLPLKNAQIRIYRSKGQQLKEEYFGAENQIKIERLEKYFYEVSADGYQDFTTDFGDKDEETAYLKKINNKITTQIVVRDIKTGKNIDDITEVTHNNLKVNKNIIKGETGSSVTLRVSAPGYYSLDTNVIAKNNTIEISLNPIQKLQTELILIEKYLKKYISGAEVRYPSNWKRELVSTNQKISKEKSLQDIIFIRAKGYETIEIPNTEPTSPQLTLSLVQSSYPLILEIIGDLSQGDIEKTRFSIQNQKVSPKNRQIVTQIAEKETIKLSVENPEVEEKEFSISFKDIDTSKWTAVDIDQWKVAVPLHKKAAPQKVSEHSLALKVIDKYTQEEIASSVNYHFDEKINWIPNPKIDVSKNINLKSKLEVRAASYQTQQFKIDAEYLKENEKTVALVREKYLIQVLFKGKGEILSNEVLKNTKFTLIMIPLGLKNDHLELIIKEKEKLTISIDNEKILDKSFTVDFEKIDFKTLTYIQELSVKPEEPKTIVQQPHEAEAKTTPEVQKAEPVPAPEKMLPAKPVPTIGKLEEGSSLEFGRKYHLSKVQFVRSTTQPLTGAEQDLKQLLGFMKSHPNAKIEIIGHTAAEGDDIRQNERLSLFRAKYVANYLFNNGIDNNRIKTKGLGSADPIAPNNTDENKALNRRIEVQVSEP